MTQLSIDMIELAKKHVKLLGIEPHHSLAPITPKQTGTTNLEQAIVLATEWASFQADGSTVSEAREKVDSAISFYTALSLFETSSENFQKIQDGESSSFTLRQSSY